jgi:hypothetical protein
MQGSCVKVLPEMRIIYPQFKLVDKRVNIILKLVLSSLQGIDNL